MFADLSTCTCRYYATRERSLTWRKGILIISHTKGLVSASHLVMTFGIRQIVRIPLIYNASASKRYTANYLLIFQFCLLSLHFSFLFILHYCQLLLHHFKKLIDNRLNCNGETGHMLKLYSRCFESSTQRRRSLKEYITIWRSSCCRLNSRL